LHYSIKIHFKYLQVYFSDPENQNWRNLFKKKSADDLIGGEQSMSLQENTMMNLYYVNPIHILLMLVCFLFMPMFFAGSMYRFHQVALKDDAKGIEKYEPWLA